MKHLKKYLKAFTLVELVIVITILTILGTISFISFQDYFADARDANRVTTIGNIENALNLQKMKTRKFPTPANAVSYTGGNSEILQGVVNKEILPDMSNDPKDPLTEQYYTYSIFENGKYYQIASQLENQVAYKNFINTTYADDYESVKVVGNYKFDPSLPSLLVVPSSVTASGIFDPNACFLLDGGKNTLTTCNETKSQMSLKDYDKSLVGYWDMETLSGTKLKDLSGNGNDGIATGGINYSTAGIGGKIGKGMNFNVSSYGVIISDSYGNLSIDRDYTQQILFYYSGTYNTNDIPIFFSKGIYPNYNYKMAFYPTDYLGGTKVNKSNWYLYTYVYNKKEGIGKYYINGGLKREGTAPVWAINNNDLILGRYIQNTSYSLIGIIDDVKIYNRALSDEEILQQAKIAGF